MAMTAKEIRSWLICQPRPVKVRVTDTEEHKHELDITPGISWRQAGESIAALHPVVLEALDAKGTLIRAVRPGDFEAADDESEPPAVETDPETARFTLVAKLLADAYRHSNDVAFARLADLFDAVNKRSESLERSLDSMVRMQRKQIEDMLEREEAEEAAEKENAEQAVLGSVIQAMKNGTAKKEGAA